VNIHAFIDNTVASSFYLVYVAWFFVKLFLYVIPLANIMLLSSENKRLNLFVLCLYMVPVVEIVAYFYIVTISLPRIFQDYENKHLSSRCLEYGLAAGIVNIVILTRLTDSFESYLTFLQLSRWTGYFDHEWQPAIGVACSRHYAPETAPRCEDHLYPGKNFGVSLCG
jgi:hypothetical protein